MISTQIKVPSLRFPEFSGDWEKSRLGDVATFLKGKGITKADTDPEGKLECIRYGELYTHYNELIEEIRSKTNLDKKFLILSKKDDVIIPASGESALDIATASCVKKEGVAYSGDLNILRTSINGLFLAYYLNNKRKYDIARYAQGASVIHLYATQMKSLLLWNPKVSDENDKIATSLSTVDQKISLLKRKREQLEQYKKGIMQQIFSQQLRFKDDDGQDFPDWTKNRVDYYVERTSDPVAVEKDESYRQIGIRSHGKGIFHKEQVAGQELGDKRVFWVHPKALVLNIVFAWEHAVALTSEREKGLIASHRFPMYVPKNNRVDLDFMALFFLRKRGKYLLGVASPGGAGRNKTLGQSNFAELKVTFPCLEEQKKIASFVNCIDQKINLAQQQIKQTQAYKQGLLQQMFV